MISISFNLCMPTPSWYGDSLQAFLPRGFTTLPWPEPLPLLSIEPLLDPIQRRPTMKDRWWRDAPTNARRFIVFFVCLFVLHWRTYRQGIRRHLTTVPGRCCSSCSKKSRTAVLEVESIESVQSRRCPAKIQRNKKIQKALLQFDRRPFPPPT